jgi:hypothetical protein
VAGALESGLKLASRIHGSIRYIIHLAATRAADFPFINRFELVKYRGFVLLLERQH